MSDVLKAMSISGGILLAVVVLMIVVTIVVVNRGSVATKEDGKRH